MHKSQHLSYRLLPIGMGRYGKISIGNLSVSGLPKNMAFGPITKRNEKKKKFKIDVTQHQFDIKINARFRVIMRFFGYNFVDYSFSVMFFPYNFF